MSGARRGRGSTRLRLRLVAQLVGVTAAACALMAWASLELIEDTLQRLGAADLEARATTVARALESLGHETAVALEALVHHLRRDDPGGVTRLVAGGAQAAGEAARLVSRVRLGGLQILDETGTVLTSAEWPEQAGLSHRALLELPQDRFVAREIAVPGGVAPAFVVRRELRVGARVLHLVGANLPDAEALERVGGDGAWLRIRRPSGEAYVVGAPPIDALGAWNPPSPAGPTPAGVAEVRGYDPAAWFLAHRAISDVEAGEGVELTLVVARSRAGIRERLARLRGALFAAAALAALLAAVAGLWIAHRVTAPVAELVRSVDAIAAGTADYTFTRATRDEFEELTSSFSRLHRSLDLQRERSRAAERVAAWRDVARRVAHEVKNPLAPIRLTVENLIRARHRGGGLFDAMFDEGAQTILEEVERLKRLVGEFSEFARLPLPDPRPTDLARLIDEVRALYATEPDLSFEVHHAPGLPPIPLDADQIARALRNIVGNAIEALRDLPPGRPRSLRIDTSIDGELVRIDLADNGPGLAPEALEKLFEPYFTTKAGGTGLGLSITYRIVTEHGGVIAAQNRRSAGTRITIRLPLAGAHAAARTNPGTPASTEQVGR